MTETEFMERARQGYNRIPLLAQAFADLETPLSLYLKLAHAQDGGRHSFSIFADIRKIGIEQPLAGMEGGFHMPRGPGAAWPCGRIAPEPGASSIIRGRTGGLFRVGQRGAAVLRRTEAGRERIIKG